MQMQKHSLEATEPVERELDRISGQFHLVTVASDSFLLPEKKLQSSFFCRGRSEETLATACTWVVFSKSVRL